jgi:uncharacterized Zn finger protein
MGYQATDIILEQATLEERQQVAGWVRKAVPGGDSWSQNYHRQVLGGFLLNLEEDRLDDEAFLQVCRETRRWQDLVDRLLTLERVDEAAAVAREVAGYDLLRLASVFMSHNQADLAEDLIRERVQAGRASPEGSARTDSRLIVWLKERAQERGDQAEALALAEELFWQRPAVPGYQELRELARPLERWNDLRADILSRLADEGKYDLLTEVYLEEEEIDLALKVVEQTRTSGRGPGWGWMYVRVGRPLRMRVARAAEGKRPREAIRLYTEAIERLIAARGRGNYAEAAGYLARVRDVYHQLEEPGTWQTLIADLREQNRRLPALQDELNKASL